MPRPLEGGERYTFVVRNCIMQSVRVRGEVMQEPKVVFQCVNGRRLKVRIGRQVSCSMSCA